jgi:hypothetical protein
MNQFLWGALVMACWTAGLCFFRFWKSTRDRLFIYFGAAFWVLMLNWVALAIVPPRDESRHQVYLLRLLAFVLILIGIVDKNRSGPRAVSTRSPNAKDS